MVMKTKKDTTLRSFFAWSSIQIQSSQTDCSFLLEARPLREKEQNIQLLVYNFLLLETE